MNSTMQSALPVCTTNASATAQATARGHFVENTYNRYYFAANGSYGDSRGLVLVDTNNFTDEDWQDIEICPDSTRLPLAATIAKQRDLENDDIRSYYEDLPEHLETLIDHLVVAIQLSGSPHPLDFEGLEEELVEARIALQSVVESLALTKQVGCSHSYKKFRTPKNEPYYECCYCGAIGVKK